jgi:hypothetical protein
VHSVGSDVTNQIGGRYQIHFLYKHLYHIEDSVSRVPMQERCPNQGTHLHNDELLSHCPHRHELFPRGDFLAMLLLVTGRMAYTLLFPALTFSLPSYCLPACSYRSQNRPHDPFAPLRLEWLNPLIRGMCAQAQATADSRSFAFAPPILLIAPQLRCLGGACNSTEIQTAPTMDSCLRVGGCAEVRVAASRRPVFPPCYDARRCRQTVPAIWATKMVGSVRN